MSPTAAVVSSLFTVSPEIDFQQGKDRLFTDSYSLIIYDYVRVLLDAAQFLYIYIHTYIYIRTYIHKAHK